MNPDQWPSVAHLPLDVMTRERSPNGHLRNRDMAASRFRVEVISAARRELHGDPSRVCPGTNGRGCRLTNPDAARVSLYIDGPGHFNCINPARVDMSECRAVDMFEVNAT
jgi:hypothetical protein